MIVVIIKKNVNEIERKERKRNTTWFSLQNADWIENESFENKFSLLFFFSL